MTFVESCSNSQSSSVTSTKGKFVLKLFLVGSVLTCATNFFSSYSHAALNEAVIQVDNYINVSYTRRGTNLNKHQIALLRDVLMTSWYAGQIPGGLLSPLITDQWGRKGAYLLATGMMTFAMVIQSIATVIHLPEMLMFGRLMASCFSPMSDAVAIMYLQEISPRNLRGVLSSLFSTGYAVMALLGIVLGIDQIFGKQLPILLGIPIIPGILCFLFLYWLPETPKFLMISENDREKALKSVEFFQGKKSENELILEEYIRESKSDTNGNEGGEGGGTMLDLFRVSYLRKALLLSYGVLALNLAFYAILQSSTYFFIYIKLEKNIAQISSTILMLTFLFSSFIASALIKRFGRRTLILIFGIGSIISLCVFVFAAAFINHFLFLRFIAFAGLIGYISCYGLAIGPISWFIPAELVPLRYRASMICVCQALLSFTVVITAFSTVPLFDIIGAFTFIPLFIIPSCIALIYLFFKLPETMGREIHEIVAELKTTK